MEDISNDNRSNDDYSNEYEDYPNEHEDFNEDFNDDFNDYLNFKNSIIYLDESLRYIINNMVINIIYDNIKVNLLDYLPLFKKGYTTNEDLRTIFVIYQYLHDIEPYTNPLYLKAFDENIPDNYIDFYQKYNDSMSIDIGEIFLENDLIKKLHEYYINDVIDMDVDGNIKLESFIKSFSNDSNWLDILLETELKLYIAIILGWKDFVEEFLNEIDPRDYDNKAYHLAIKIGNKENIELIKNKIILLNWLDKQVVIKEFKKYDFLSDDIIEYYQSRKY